MSQIKISDLPPLGTVSDSTIIPVVDAGSNKKITGAAIKSYIGTVVGPTGPAGASGSAGASGASGPRGYNGSTGANGTNGTNGTNGYTGSAGASGPAGAAGYTGSAGANGSAGATGAQGASGIAGASGSIGATGASGVAGASGARGYNGSAGTNGTNGVAGATGPAGATGVTGPAGATGVTGPAGATGARGYNGSAGTNGTNGVAGATGPQGNQGVTGYTGSFGATGPAGATGASGARGYNGSAGTNGVAGYTGSVGATGPQGNDGTGVTILGSYADLAALTTAQPTGTSGDAYILTDTGHLAVWTGSQWNDVGSIQGPQGNVGATGATGPGTDQDAQLFTTGTPTFANINIAGDVTLSKPVTTTRKTITGTLADTFTASGGAFGFRVLQADNTQLIVPLSDPTFKLFWTAGDAESNLAQSQGTATGNTYTITDDGTYWSFAAPYGLNTGRPVPATVFTVEYGVVHSDTTVSTSNTNLVLKAQNSELRFDMDGNITVPGRIQGGPGSVNSIDLSWDLSITSGKTIKINPGSGGVVSDKFWNFGADGSLTIPGDGSIDTYSGTGGFKITTDGQIQFASGYSIGGSDTGLGLRMATDRGTILFGNHPEVQITSSHHFHIMAQDPGATDLFFGSDENFVKLPRGTSDVVIGNGNNYNWTFANDGTLTLPAVSEINTKNNDGLVNQRINLYGGDSALNLTNYTAPVLGQTFTTADWATATWNGTSLSITGSAGFVTYINTLTTALVLRINGGIWNEIGGRESGGDFVTFDNLSASTATPVTVTQLDVYTRTQASLGVFGDTVAIFAPNNSNWTFDGNGALTLPGGQVIGGSDSTQGITMTTARGTVLFGNTPEVQITSSHHFHIMAADSSATDLFFGSDENFVKLPRGTNDVVIGNGNNYNWQFGDQGTLTLPLGGTITETARVTQGGDTPGTMVLTPNNVFNPWNNLTIYNTAFNPETQHIHLASGDLNRTEIVLGNDSKFVKVNIDGSVCVNSSPYYFEDAMAFEFQNTDNTITEMRFSLGVYPRLYYVAVGDIITDVSNGNTATITGVDNAINLSITCSIPMDTNGTSTLGYSFSKPNNNGGLWQFGTDGKLTVPGNIKSETNNSLSIQTESLPTDPPTTIVISGADFAAVNLTYTKDGANLIWYPANYNPSSDPYIEFAGVYGINVPGFSQAIYVNTGTLNVPLAQWNTNPPLGSVAPTGVYTYPNTYAHSWTFGADGSLTFPDTGLIDDNGGIFRIKSTNTGGVQLGSADDQNYVTVGTNDVVVQTNSDALAGKTQYNWAFGTDGNLTIPGDLINPDGFILNAGEHGSLAIGKFIETPGVDEHFHIAFPDSNSQVPYQDLYLGNDFNYVKIRGSHDEQTMGVDIGVEGQHWEFNPGGTLQYPHNAVQQPTDTVTCAGNTSTVVYTASGQYQHTIKLLIQVEGIEAPETINWDTQACEMMVAKSLITNNIASTVYGIVHTSTAPLATFTAQWNALTNRVQVLCATPGANGVHVRTFATEIYSAD